MQEYHPFWVPFWKIKVSNWLIKKKKLLNLVDWDNPECKIEKHFTDYYSESDYIKEFSDILLYELELFAKNFPEGFKIKEVWAQRYTGYHFMNPHTHGPRGFSAVLYAEFNPKVHKPTTFYSPFNGFINGEPLEHAPEMNEGEMIIFPSSVLHFAEPSNSEEQRTIFSWNMI